MYRIMSHALATTLLALAGTVSAQSDRLEEGRQAFDRHCSECHENPATEAPTAGDTSDWENRSKLWEAVLTEHAQKGYFKMPAQGGADGASDYEVKAATEYMLTLSHPDLPHD